MTVAADWEPLSDYDDQMTAVQEGLLSYEGTHCKHGTFTGNWAGPDYLCFHCEMGTTDEEYAEEQRWAERRRNRARAASRILREKVLPALRETPDGPAREQLFNRLGRLITAGGRA